MATLRMTPPGTSGDLHTIHACIEALKAGHNVEVYPGVYKAASPGQAYFVKRNQGRLTGIEVNGEYPVFDGGIRNHQQATDWGSGSYLLTWNGRGNVVSGIFFQNVKGNILFVEEAHSAPYGPNRLEKCVTIRSFRDESTVHELYYRGGFIVEDCITWMVWNRCWENYSGTGKFLGRDCSKQAGYTAGNHAMYEKHANTASGALSTVQGGTFNRVAGIGTSGYTAHIKAQRGGLRNGRITNVIGMGQSGVDFDGGVQGYRVTNSVFCRPPDATDALRVYFPKLGETVGRLMNLRSVGASVQGNLVQGNLIQAYDPNGVACLNKGSHPSQYDANRWEVLGSTRADVYSSDSRGMETTGRFVDQRNKFPIQQDVQEVRPGDYEGPLLIDMVASLGSLNKFEQDNPGLPLYKHPQFRTMLQGLKQKLAECQRKGRGITELPMSDFIEAQTGGEIPPPPPPPPPEEGVYYVSGSSNCTSCTGKGRNDAPPDFRAYAQQEIVEIRQGTLIRDTLVSAAESLTIRNGLWDIGGSGATVLEGDIYVNEDVEVTLEGVTHDGTIHYGEEVIDPPPPPPPPPPDDLQALRDEVQVLRTQLQRVDSEGQAVRDILAKIKEVML